MTRTDTTKSNHPQQRRHAEVTPTLKSILKRLKLSGLLEVLPSRAQHARDQRQDPLDFLELILQDEIERRDHRNITLKTQRANLDPTLTMHTYQWDTHVTLDTHHAKDLLTLNFLHRHEDVILQGPTGTGKTHLATAIAHHALHHAITTHFTRADHLFKHLQRSRADNTTEKTFRTYTTPQLLIIDDFGLQPLTPQQSSDLYELILERHKRTSTIITSNRHVDEWIPLFHDPLLAQSALDRLAHNAHQLTHQGDSYRTKQRPTLDNTPKNMHNQQ